MNKAKLSAALLALTVCLTMVSCSPTVKTTGLWVNKERLKAPPVKSVFIIALTDNKEARVHFEDALAAAAEKRGLKAYKSTDVIGIVDMKYIAPVKDVFVKKLQDLNCEAVFTVALVHEISETKYVSGSTYIPYSYNAYGGYTGYGAYGAYGGFGGYYGYAVSTMSTPGYYATDKKYFIEAKVFDLKTDELLLSIQSKAENPDGIEKASKQYAATIIEDLNDLRKK